MTKKLILTLGCLALLASLSSIAMADAITFTLVGASKPVHIDSSGLSGGPASVLLVSDTNVPANHLLLGTASISTGAASGYTEASNVVTAQYLAGTGVEINVKSPSCLGGTMPGVCLQGSSNSDGQYVANKLGAGSFQAIFHVDYVSPTITGLFGDPNAWLPMGSDSFNTGINVFKNGGKTDTALLTAGTITFQTPVPEPGTLTLVGSAFVGAAGILRRKIKL